MDPEYREDRGGELLRMVERPDGTWLVEGYAAREGVLVYRNTDGTERRELVPLATLRASAGGLARAPVTLHHPRENVAPHNFGRLGVGDTDGEVQVEDGGFVRVRLAIRRQDAIDAVRGGVHELSPGYQVTLDNTPGVHPVYGRYDAIQRERRYNHLAIVDAARGGTAIRMRVDGSRVDATPEDRRAFREKFGEQAPAVHYTAQERRAYQEQRATYPPCMCPARGLAARRGAPPPHPCMCGAYPDKSPMDVYYIAHPDELEVPAPAPTENDDGDRYHGPEAFERRARPSPTEGPGTRSVFRAALDRPSVYRDGAPRSDAGGGRPRRSLYQTALDRSGGSR